MKGGSTATVIDLATRMVVGWQMADHTRTSLVTGHRRPQMARIHGRLATRRVGQAPRTHCHLALSRRPADSRSSCNSPGFMYWLLDSGLAWPSTAAIVASGTVARSSLDAALWRRNRVPAFTSATPALRK